MSRDDQVKLLQDRQAWPVLVIGGGINGAGVLRDLAMQGVDALLVTKGDFAEGATAGSSRMIHGGLRYLEQSEFRLVKESLADRNALLLHARHYVKPLQTTIPIFSRTGGLREALLKLLRIPTKTGQRGAVWVKLGLSIYDFYTRHARVLPRHRFESAAAVFQRMPQLNQEIKCAAVYHDAWVSHPERLCHEIVRDARLAHAGVLALNYVSASSLESGRVRLRCELGGETFDVQPQVVVNATGAWIDQTNRGLGESTEFIGGAKGSHLVLDHPELRAVLDGEILYENPDGRVCLVMPFHDRVIIGSTDIPVDSPEEARCDEEEIEYLLDGARGVLPGFTFDCSQILSHYCAVRPLPRSDAPRPGLVSRDHSCRLTKPAGERLFPVYSLIGGKWTTFRTFAEEVTDRVIADLDRSRKGRTVDVDIGGARGMPDTEEACESWLASQPLMAALPEARKHMLLTRYGTRCLEVVAYIAAGDDDALLSVPGYSRREIAFLCENEDVVHLEDVLLRRTSLALLGHLGLADLEEITMICADSLGWSASRRDEEKARALRILRNTLGVTLA